MIKNSGALSAILKLSPFIVVANLANYGFQIGSGRLLGPDAFGVLSGILSIMAVISVGTSGLQTQVALHTTLQLPTNSKQRFDSLTKQATVFGICLALAFLVSVPFLSNFWRIGNLPLLAIAMYAPVAIWTAIAQGRYQGRSKFQKLYFFSTIQSISKIGVLFLAVVLGLGSTFLLLGLVLTSGFIAIVSLLSRGNPGGLNVKLFQRTTGHFTFSSFSYWVLLYLDLIIARHAIGTSAGDYTAFSVLTKAVIWTAAIFGQILFPRLVVENNKGFGTGRTVRTGLLSVFILSSAAALFFMVFGSQVVGLLYGSSFNPERTVVIALALSVVPWSVSQFVLAVNFAQERHSQSVFLGVVLVLSTGGFVLASSATQLAFLELAVAVSVCSVLLWVSSKRKENLVD
jgi:O-antigen/teichoic acid export membrane protein